MGDSPERPVPKPRKRVAVSAVAAVAEIVQPPGNDFGQVWKEIGRLEAADKLHERQYETLTKTVSSTNAKVDALAGEFHTAMKSFGDVAEFVKGEKEHRAALARQLAATAVAQAKRDAELTRTLQSLLPLVGAVIAIILTGAWSRLGDLPNTVYWIMVGASLVVALVVYLLILRRGGAPTPAPPPSEP